MEITTASHVLLTALPVHSRREYAVLAMPLLLLTPLTTLANVTSTNS